TVINLGLSPTIPSPHMIVLIRCSSLPLCVSAAIDCTTALRSTRGKSGLELSSKRVAPASSSLHLLLIEHERASRQAISSNPLAFNSWMTRMTTSSDWEPVTATATQHCRQNLTLLRSKSPSTATDCAPASQMILLVFCRRSQVAPHKITRERVSGAQPLNP